MRNSTRYVLWLIGVLIIIIILVLIFASITKPKSTSNTPTVTSPSSLSSYADTDAVVTYTVQGVIQGNEQYRAITIIVSKTARTVQVMQGFQGQILKSQTTPNNPQAFKQFLAAIQTEGFLSVRKNPPVSNIEGQCPLGNRYVASSSNIPNVPNNLWSTTCGSKQGTWAGNVTSVGRLFNLQIPNYSQFVSDVAL